MVLVVLISYGTNWMITYNINWMGPISLDFIQKNGNNWAAGRIDICNPSGLETSIRVPVIDKRSWALLGKWLRSYKTKEIDYDVINSFQKETGHKITFLYSKDIVNGGEGRKLGD